MKNDLIIKLTKTDVELALGYELKNYSLHPYYENGTCQGLEIIAEPVKDKIWIPINLLIEKHQ